MSDQAKKADPTVTSLFGGPEYPEGTHPPRPASETHHWGGNIEYADVADADKPDRTTIAQVEVPRHER